MSFKHIEIADELRREVVRGAPLPGSRFPTRTELERRFGASRATVQKALECLAREGFVRADGRRGTFVADHPPHLSHYGLVFDSRPRPGRVDGVVRTTRRGRDWSRFWTALRNEAIGIEQSRPGRVDDQERPGPGVARTARPGLESPATRIPIYYGVNGSPEGEDQRKLAEDVLAHRLAGVVFASYPSAFAGTPILDEPGVPRVCILEHDAPPGVRTVYPDQRSLFDKALDYLAERGRRRIALVTVSTLQARHLEHFLAGAASRGMTVGPQWTQAVSLDRAARRWTRNLVHLLMDAGAERRPDGLFVADDNLVEHATAGLIAAGVSVGEDVDVVAHCNFPWPPPSVLPLKRLGFDIRRLLEMCIDTIRRARQGRRVPAVQKLAAVFEEDVQGETSEAARVI